MREDSEKTDGFVLALVVILALLVVAGMGVGSFVYVRTQVARERALQVQARRLAEQARAAAEPARSEAAQAKAKAEAQAREHPAPDKHSDNPL
jgi:uncharacterized protein HemX